jgi:hypothetical protein
MHNNHSADKARRCRELEDIANDSLLIFVGGMAKKHFSHGTATPRHYSDHHCTYKVTRGR